MAKIYSLKIENFRGIQNFEQTFGDTNLVCILGRGDSGKTTILEAISMVLSPSWSLTLIDSDFFECNIENPIVIEATLLDLPPALMTEGKYGLYKRGLSTNGQINDTVQDDDSDLLTIRLTVEKDLEPTWTVVSERMNQTPAEIKASDRAQLNAFYVSDYIDRHFSWNRGTPLYSLLKAEQSASGVTDAMIEALRDAKTKIDGEPFTHLDTVTQKIIQSAQRFGLDISDTSTTVDLKDLTIKDGRICLHDGNIPFRLKGKGSKRLISIAVQMELASAGGIILIDEIEQGLEPDRAKHLARTLKDIAAGQVFITTHSRDVLVELEASNLYKLRKGNPTMFLFGTELQGVIRRNPEALFAEKILIGEGITEVGITRGLDNKRIQQGRQSMATLGVVPADGGGSQMIEYAHGFITAGYSVALFCDSDRADINQKKPELIARGCVVIDCEDDNDIEHQVFKDLPWEGVKDLMEYHIDRSEAEAVVQAIRSKFPTGSTFPEDWINTESSEMRKAISVASGKGKWFKMIGHGEYIAEVCHTLLPATNDNHMKTIVESLSTWIENA